MTHLNWRGRRWDEGHLVIMTPIILDVELPQLPYIARV